MQPLLVSTAFGHGSSVTPKSTFVPSFPVWGAADSWERQPGTAKAMARGTASAASMLRRMVMGCLTFRSYSVRERPCLPVIADANPYAEQAFGFEYQEPDDQ